MAERFDRDTELMLRFQAGEEACFEELVERHKQRVFRTAYRFLGMRQGAEDIAQEVFLRVYRARDTYEPRARFTTWLYAICRNTCFKRLRKQSGSPVSLSNEVELEEGSAPHQLADARAPSPLESALRDERAPGDAPLQAPWAREPRPRLRQRRRRLAWAMAAAVLAAAGIGAVWGWINAQRGTARPVAAREPVGIRPGGLACALAVDAGVGLLTRGCGSARRDRVP